MRSPFSIRNRRDFLRASAVTLAASALPTSLFAFNNFSAGTSPSKPHRIILDTDPGVDDAIAIFVALRSPELHVEAVTPVCGNVPLSLTLPNALRLVEIAGRTDIPVAAGAATPLVRRLVTATYAHGENGLGGAVFPEPTPKPVATPASELIRQIVRTYPGEVTLIPIGP